MRLSSRPKLYSATDTSKHSHPLTPDKRPIIDLVHANSTKTHTTRISSAITQANYFSKGTPRKSNVWRIKAQFFIHCAARKHSKFQCWHFRGFIHRIHCVLNRVLTWILGARTRTPKRNIWSAQGIDCHSQSPKPQELPSEAAAAASRFDEGLLSHASSLFLLYNNTNKKMANNLPSSLFSASL